MRSFRTLALLIPLLALPSVTAGPTNTPPLHDVIYLGNKTVLTALPPRQLTLNAHIGEFQYQPGGHSIAYTGGQVNFTPGHLLDSSVTEFIKVAGVGNGSATNLMTVTTTARDMAQLSGESPEEIAKQAAEADAHPEEMAKMAQSNIPVTSHLLGWSGDARYLLVKRDQVVKGAEGTPVFRTTYYRFDLGISPPAQSEILVPQVDETSTTFSTSTPSWSPQHRLILFSTALITHPAPVPNAPGDTPPPKPQAVYSALLYDPAGARLIPVALADGYQSLGWLDEGHLLLQKRVRKTPTVYAAYDITNGQQAAIPKPAKMPTPDDETPSPVSPISPALSLDVQAHSIVDSQKVSKQASHVLWLRRAPAKLPLSALPVGLTPGDADPKPQWSPSGQQIAFVSHGDLFVTDLISRPASLDERLIAGEKLPCPEEKQVAMNRVKQIGLGLMMYVQDYDETFPSAEGLHDKVYPYLKNEDVFQVGSAPFVYQGKQQSLAKIDSPATEILGTMDLPCGKIILYADGHVISQDKRQSGGCGGR